jgi:hypothetical protein
MYCPGSVTGRGEGNLEGVLKSILLRLVQLLVTINYSVGDTREGTNIITMSGLLVMELRFIADLMERGPF